MRKVVVGWKGERRGREEGEGGKGRESGEIKGGWEAGRMRKDGEKS